MLERELALRQLTEDGCSGSHLEDHFGENPTQERPRIAPDQQSYAVSDTRASHEGHSPVTTQAVCKEFIVHPTSAVAKAIRATRTIS